MSELYDYEENGWRFEHDDWVDSMEDPPVLYMVEWCKKTFVRDYPDGYDDGEYESDIFDNETKVEICVQGEPALYEETEDGDWVELPTGTIGLADSWENGINVQFPHYDTYGYGYSWADNLKRKLYDIAYTCNFSKTLNVIDTFMMLEGWHCDDN